MTIAPETKDWTWVLERACPDCGFDASNLDPSKVPALMAQVAAAWQEVLAGAGVEVAQRPSDDRWTTREYACHVRAVFRLTDVRFSPLLDRKSGVSGRGVSGRVEHGGGRNTEK